MAGAAAAAGGESKTMMGIKELVDSGLHAVPPVFVRPPHERPDALQAPPHLQSCIPVIDLGHLDDAAARNTLIQQIGCACQEWGFFQVVNHGVEPALIQRLVEVAPKFFMQPAKERMCLYTENLYNPVIYTTTSNPSLAKDWRETLTLNRYPGIFDGFQQAPDICKKEVQEYIGEVEVLARRLYKAIFESMGLDKEYIEAEVPGIPRETMGINYYPSCPDPTLTLGVGGHSDVSSLTILHAGDVPGLQIKYKGCWVRVFPVDPNAFVVNLADQIEILTNGKYKSIEHRVVTNGERPRLSIACFFGPLEDTIVAPLPKILNENNPPLYKPTKFKEYFKKFSKTPFLSDRGTLQEHKITPMCNY